MDKDLQSLFAEAYGQALVSTDELSNVNKKKVQAKERKIVSKKYALFLEKYADLEKYIDSFKSLDLTYFFREKSKETGNWYSIRNMRRDMGIFKRLLFDYTPVEICTMIEFLFESGQKYLPTKDLQPTVLSSTWCNTVYADTVKWVSGTFDDTQVHTKSKTGAKQRNVEREWHSGKPVAIGDWG